MYYFLGQGLIINFFQKNLMSMHNPAKFQQCVG
jgi:hypothetical protein